MPEGILPAVSAFILKVIESWSYLGIFFLMFLESANLPIPSEIIMPFAGFLVSAGKLNFISVVFVGALGNLTGSVANYFIAYYYGREVIKILSKLFLFEARDFEVAESWFKKFGLFSAFFARVVPIVRTFISFPAGMFKVNLLEFSLLTFTGSFIWSFFLTYIGYTAGENWNVLQPYFRKFDYLIVFLIFMAFIWWLRRRQFPRSVQKL